jgi:hypothetical protein
MKIKRWILMLVALASSATAFGQVGKSDPRIGYLHPAGACVATTTEIIAGGRNLRGMKEVRVSGTGVEARVIKTYRPMKNLDPAERELLKWHIACRRAELDGKPLPPEPKPQAGPDGKLAAVVELPEMLLLDLLKTLDPVRLEHWVTVLQRIGKNQQNSQPGELVRLEIKVAANAEPGIRELRLGGPLGLSNPLRFAVGTLPEIFENEPNEPAVISNETAATLPCTFNGQILAGDVDVFRFRARAGRNLVVRGEARNLIPYLADAVPGWFQMVVALRDSKGREIAYADDFRFDPDPVLNFKVPADGDYQLEVRDSIFRGREDFVYRVSVGELPFITSSFPLGGREGVPLVTAVRGWNLPGDKLGLDTTVGGQAMRVARMVAGISPSNEVSYAVDFLPEAVEIESNDDSDRATAVSFPCVINGRIDKPGDADVFRIEGLKGREMMIEVLARRLKSPLDSVVHVADERGKILGWNDDAMDKDGHLQLGDGLLTHHADSRLRVKLTTDGPVFVRIADTQLHGGPDHAYRLRLCESRPDFELRVTPSVLNVPPGGHVPLQVHVMRNGGFEGEIQLGLIDAPSGFYLSGSTVPAGATQVRLTLTTPAQGKDGVYTPRLIGTAGEGEKAVTVTALAADDMMQAFLWRHMVPAGEWLVSVNSGRGRSSAVELESPLPLRIPVGGLAEVKVKVPKWIVDRNLQLELSDAPPGIRLSAVRKTPGGLAFDVLADSSAASGLETNLIIEAFADAPAKKQAAKNSPRAQVATLPAIPISLIHPTAP